MNRRDILRGATVAAFLIPIRKLLPERLAKVALEDLPDDAINIAPFSILFVDAWGRTLATGHAQEALGGVSVVEFDVRKTGVVERVSVVRQADAEEIFVAKGKDCLNSVCVTVGSIVRFTVGFVL